MRCKVPVVVTETLSTKWIMRQKQELLVKPGNIEELCNKIKSALHFERIEYE